ncbi:MAG TPA: FAD-binding oxidoreductase [Symbiobacteriaceae bacterium]|jgi:4-cresol dehydrogenase (hydroxylating)
MQQTMQQHAGLVDALAAWREAIGPEHVLTEGTRLGRAQQTTFATWQRSPALLEPADREEVSACLRIAQRCRVPVYPVSGGKNYGYGSRVCPQDGTVLLSLARLNRIVAFSEELAYVTVEPGVTFRMLAEFLCRQDSRLMPPVTGTTADASLTGLVVERGLGKGPYEDMAAHTCGYEVVLPTGETVCTGFAALPGAAAAPLRMHGPGPSLQGLFGQSNLGVVTRLTLWLEPAPALRQRAFFLIPEAADLPPVIDALRNLLLRCGGLQAEVINDYRVTAMSRQFPFDLFTGEAALPREWMRATQGDGYGRWVAGLFLWAGDEAELDWRRRRLTAALAGLSGQLILEEPARYDPYDAPNGMRSTYWRKRMAPPPDPDPDRDRCGLIWTAPVLPLLGPEVSGALEEIEAVVLGFGFEPSIALRLVGGRAAQAVVALVYDRDVPGADARAAACHAAIRSTTAQRGIYPYRLGILDMAEPPVGAAQTAALLASLKRLVDPQGVLAPGRYIRS